MMPTPTIIPIRDAVAQVRKLFPPGTIIRQRANGKQYVMGAKCGLSTFDMTSVGSGQKMTQHANRIVLAFEKVGK